MDWTDAGLVLSVRKHGETSVVLECLTRDHGRHLGLTRGGRSRAMRASLQPGNRLNVVWRARLEEQLGTYQAEADVLRAGRLMERATSLHGLNWVTALLRLLPEREPHPKLFAMADVLCERLSDVSGASELLVRFELALLSELGFGLDLRQCALTGARENLRFVSPRSGRAACAAAAAPWSDRLLALPAFLTRSWGSDAGGEAAPSREDLCAGFSLTEHFLKRDLFEPRGVEIPAARGAFTAIINGSRL